VSLAGDLAETHAVRRAEDGEPITWLGRRLRWTVVALNGGPSGGWRRAEQSIAECECGEGKLKTGTTPFGLVQRQGKQRGSARGSAATDGSRYGGAQRREHGHRFVTGSVASGMGPDDQPGAVKVGLGH
jgi:hypothetical protein